MPKAFYDRENELKQLIERLEMLKKGEFIVMYGRRRVGKTEIVKQFIEGMTVKNLYFYVDLMEKPGLIASMTEEIGKQLKDIVKFDNWDGFFDYIYQVSLNEKFVLVIDEFQRFLEISPDFISKLQRYWDEKLKDNKLMIIIVGSSIGMMSRITKSSAAPLYGRISSRMKISPFRYVDFRKMFKSMNEEEKIIHYSVFGGTPYYLTQIKDIEGDVYKRITATVLNRGGKLYEEPMILMESENIRTHARYNSILQSIALGKEITKEIQDFTHIPTTTLPAYLKRLVDLLDLIYKKEPILGKERHGRYRLKDNFFNFWYRFIFPNQNALNLGNIKLIEDDIKANLNSYIGRVFESVVHELLALYMNKKIKNLDINFEEIGSWWDRKSNEIDIVAYNKKQKIALAGEIKWTNEKADIGLLDELIRKSKLINFNGSYKFILVSKNGFTQKCLEKMDDIGCIHLDLNDIEKLFNDA